jgi:hypothetical protein
MTSIGLTELLLARIAGGEAAAKAVEDIGADGFDHYLLKKPDSDSMVDRVFISRTVRHH